MKAKKSKRLQGIAESMWGTFVLFGLTKYRYRWYFGKP